MPSAGSRNLQRIQSLTIRIGSTSIRQPGSSFRENLTQPLTTVFNQAVNYRLDPGSANPHPWGDPGGTLTFAFSVPGPIVLAAGEWLVVDYEMIGNGGASAGHQNTDFHRGSGDPTGGTGTLGGTGCSPGGTIGNADLRVFGNFRPGRAYALDGSNLGANAPVLTTLSADITRGPGNIGLPFAVPGTRCAIYTGWEFFLHNTADAAGNLIGTRAGTYIRGTR